ncbi:MAG: hypothetical protein ACI8ZN_000724 [Bacteroidia bacterium]|jgi:hypothetical protein
MLNALINHKVFPQRTFVISVFERTKIVKNSVASAVVEEVYFFALALHNTQM